MTTPASWPRSRRHWTRPPSCATASALCTTRVPQARTAAARRAGWSKAPSVPDTEKLASVSHPSTALSWA
eukprot:7681814-Alexandrium_andersonii.AAC.1